MAAAHARSQSSIPGFVVIVLATAAILFGIAFVRKSNRSGDELVRELRLLREQVSEQAEEIQKIERSVNQYGTTASNLDLDISSLRSMNEALEDRVDAIAGGEPASSSADADDEAAAAVAAVQAEAEARFDAQAVEIAELTAEIFALNDRANQLEHTLAEARAATDAAPATAEPTGEIDVAPEPTREAQTEPAATESTATGPAETEPAETEPVDPPQELEPEAPASTLETARRAAEENVDLLAPFFGHGYEQPDGSRTADAGPMSFAALADTGALDPLTSDVLEENEALRKLTRVASNSPNDRDLWPYSRGDRTKTWYLRKDGRADVPLAHELLVQHGAAFVELGLLAE